MFTTLALTFALAAQPPMNSPADPPKGPPPALVHFKADGDSLVRSVLVTKAVPVQKTAEVERVVNGQTVKETVAFTEYQTVTTTQPVKIPAKEATYATAAGKKLTTDEALARLKDGAICVVVHTPRTVEAAYLKAFKDDTLIITLPPAKPEPVLPQPAPPKIEM